MKNNILRTNLATGLLILLAGLFGAAGLTQGATIYVDDDNTSGPWDGTPEHPYQIIQDGMDSAASGDTVFVFNGIYYENVVVDKAINLIGEDRDSTVIDGDANGTGIYVSADSVSIGRFLIRNCGYEDVPAGVAVYLDNVIGVSICGNNIANNNMYGIELCGSSENRIFRNTMSENVRVGLLIRPESNNNVISQNFFFGNDRGVMIGSSTNDNLLYHNNFMDNDHNAADEGNNTWDDGYPSGGNYWDDYTGVDENWDGIGDTWYGIPQEHPSPSAYDRYPLMQPWHGIVFVDDDQVPEWYDSTHLSTIQEGIDSAADNQIVYVYSGRYGENLIVDKRLCLVGGNMDSVMVEWGGDGDVLEISAKGVEIRGFTVQNSGSGTGVKIYSDSNIIHGNNIMGAAHGIWVLDSAEGNLIFHNNFTNNSQNACDEGTNAWNDVYPSCGNYWDDYAGDDSCHGPNQNFPGSDGIGDMPYDVSNGANQDRYPLMNPWVGVSPVPIRDTIYVDDDYDENTIGWEWDHFDKIQSGIDAVSEYKTVCVFNGTYNENLVIDKTINLIGEDKKHTIVDVEKAGTVIHLSADSVNISGFTICNGSVEGIYGRYVDYNTICDNIITSNTQHGILLCWSAYNIISENTITLSATGVYLDGNDNVVCGNFIVHNSFGIYTIASTGNEIFDNLIRDNSWGIYLASSSGSKIYHNDFVNSYRFPATSTEPNVWDDGYPSGGNYWGGYTGSDSYSGPNQDLPGSDGIGDTPYDIEGEGGDQDRYPLMNPWVLPPLNCSDVNMDELVNVQDVVYLINYLFKNGPSPMPLSCIGDANGDGEIGILDVVYLINYLLKSGPAPSPDCCNQSY